jgi:hypothetical protein
MRQVRDEPGWQGRAVPWNDRVGLFDRDESTCRCQEPGEYPSSAQVQVSAGPRDNECLSQISFVERSTRVEPIRTTKNFPDPMKMKAQWISQMALFGQPNGKCLQLSAEPGLLVSLIVPGKKIAKHGFLLHCRGSQANFVQLC